MFKPITFDYQSVKSKNDGGLYNAIFIHDGIIWGCDVTVTATSVTFSSGEIIVGGRIVWVDGATTVQITNPIQNGYARIKARIDLTKEARPTEIEQFETVLEYSTTTLFPDLAQEAINDTGTIYEQELVVVKIDAGNVTAITRKMGNAIIDAAKLNGQLPEYYATKAEVDSKAPAASPVFTGPVTANGGVRLPDNQQVAWSTGWGIYAIDANTLYIKAPTGHNKYLHFGISGGAWSLLPNTPVQLGTANYKWDQIYSTNPTISTSDLKDKKDIVLMTEEQARPFIMALKPCLYKLIDGTSGRTHYGLIAQEVEEAIQECGISDMEFAGFIKSPKIEREQVGTTKDGAPVYRDKVIEGEYVYGLRYEEFIAPIISVAQSLMQENEVLKGRMDELEKRIEALEEK